MVCLVNDRSKFCKRVLLDIWGHTLYYSKVNRVVNFIAFMKEQALQRKWYFKREFVYSLKKRVSFPRKKKLEKEYLQPRLVTNFYLVLHRKHFRRMFDKAVKKSGFFEGNYLLFLEGRLFSFVYRANFITNIFMLKSMLDSNIFQVNFEIRSYANYNINVGDFITIMPFYFIFVQRDLMFRLRNNIIFWKVPAYMFVDNKFMFAFMFKKPLIDEVPFPIDFDVYSGGDFGI